MDSQAIINTMEVLTTKPINELVSETVIKVCYVSDIPNPNKTVITREVGKEIASTLPGAPVAGFFDKGTGDFEEHSRRITFQNGEVISEDITRPYGFVSPVDNPWYQDFTEDGVIRTYLMCKAYLWTRQYEEASLAVNKGQSMELDEKSMSGYYEGDVFIFTSVTLDKLCILGDAYAPCFSGAKIMTTYAKQYETLAEKLEKTIGRRYYVMKDQLVEKPAKTTIEYAVELGWNLTDAVELQLHNRGMKDFFIEGIYADGETIFAIIHNRVTMEFNKVDIVISSNQTIELGTEFQAVSMDWTPKAPIMPEIPEPLNGADAVVDVEIPLNVSAVFKEDGGEILVTKIIAAKPEPALGDVQPTGFTAKIVPTITPIETPVDFIAPIVPVMEPTVDPVVSAPVADFTAPVPAPAPVPVPVPAPVPVPTVDFSIECQIKDTEIASLKGQIVEFTNKIATLETTVATYQATEATMIAEQKESLMTSYSELLTEDEIKPIKEKIAEFSLEQIEAKLAITYARKHQGVPSAPTTQFQVNIGAVPVQNSNLPDFMKEALEFDKARELRL